MVIYLIWMRSEWDIVMANTLWCLVLASTYPVLTAQMRADLGPYSHLLPCFPFHFHFSLEMVELLISSVHFI